MEAPLRVPDPQRLGAVQRVGDLTAPFTFAPDYPALFAEAMREITAWHESGSEFYRRVLRQEGTDPLPLIPATFFKLHEILSIPRGKVLMHFTSSGTTGQKSQVFFDEWSYRSGQRMVDSTFQHFGFVTPDKKTNYLLYSYEPAGDSKLGTQHTDNYLCRYAPINSVFWALRRNGSGGHDFDVNGCIEHLQRFAAEGLPVRVFGFPAFFFFTLNRMRELGLPKLRLHPDSLIFLGGGWKGHTDQEVSKDDLYRLVADSLGLSDDRVRDSFGAVEHPIPYAECAHHHFHVPVWSRVVIRDVRTLKPCGFGEPGFLNFLTPFITSMPAHNVLMGDLASLYPRDGVRLRYPEPVLPRARARRYHQE